MGSHGRNIFCRRLGGRGNEEGPLALCFFRGPAAAVGKISGVTVPHQLPDAAKDDGDDRRMRSRKPARWRRRVLTC